MKSVNSPYGNVNIIFEDDDILIINKPHGLHTVEDRYKSESYTLRSVLDDIYGKVYVVHRLDAGTGGIITVAKNAKAHVNLCAQFERGLVKKEYYAIVSGRFGGDISLMLPISPKVSHGKFKINFKSGKKAVTTFICEKRYDEASLLKVIPFTGRSHQIRVHLKALKHPLYHDWVYNADENSMDKRLSLFACGLRLNHPVSGKELIFNLPLSEYMKELLNKVQNGV